MTQTSAFRRFVFILTIAGALAAAGCGGKEVKKDEGNVPNAAQADEASGDSDSGKAMGLQTVHFPYDAFTLDSEAKSLLKANADILKEHGNVKVQIEGHCDQRGGIQYNIALGEKRANAAKKYLEGLGITDDRITTISFGKERPIDQGTTEEAYAKNRRANFVITSK
jgi:peptidoglycan-associated lipoprotein